MLLILLSVLTLKAQVQKTAVIVVGSGNAAWAAGLQSAQSGVKTIVICPATELQPSLPQQPLTSGIAAAFAERFQQEGNTPMNQVLKKWADSTKNLQLHYTKGELKFSRSGGNWQVRLSNGETFKAKVLINAGGYVVDEHPDTPQTFQPLDLQHPQYRTAIASGDVFPAQQQHASLLYLPQLLHKELENYVQLKGLEQSYAAGQAGGAIAAYAAFFKTKTSKTDLKAIQGELLNYKQALMPLADVAGSDSNWRALQVMALMGVFQLDLHQGKLHFHPEQQASFSDIKPAISAFYYKANLWFEDHKDAVVSLDQAISLICYVGNKSVSQVKKEVEKKWQVTYHFSPVSAVGQVLTRRQFAVLLHDHLQIFNIVTDASGRVII